MIITILIKGGSFFNRSHRCYYADDLASRMRITYNNRCTLRIIKF